MTLGDRAWWLWWRIKDRLSGKRLYSVTYLPADEYLGTRHARSMRGAWLQVCREGGEDPANPTIWGPISEYRIEELS